MDFDRALSSLVAKYEVRAVSLKIQIQRHNCGTAFCGQQRLLIVDCRIDIYNAIQF